jgi:3-hydroxyisobutyrate dehydrogenase-like beta-hydroxyacid dehydrogenase
MTHSAIGSPMLAARAPLMRELPDTAWFDLVMMQKDLRLALDSAREEGVPLPSTTMADQVLTTARAAGYERRDIASLFRALSEMVTATPGGASGAVTP